MLVLPRANWGERSCVGGALGRVGGLSDGPCALVFLRSAGDRRIQVRRGQAICAPNTQSVSFASWYIDRVDSLAVLWVGGEWKSGKAYEALERCIPFPS